MSWDNRVIWSEGLFLRPHHLQQSDRYFEKLVRARSAPLRGYGWGITALTLNREMLSVGKIAISVATGIMEDGTPFSIPDDADQPVPFDVPANLRDSVIYLVVPIQQPGGIEVETKSAPDLLFRYALAEQDIADVSAFGRETVALDVARLRFQILSDASDLSGYTCLPIAKLIEIRADRQVILEDGHIPPVLDCAANAVLANYITEIRGLLHHRAEALAGRLGESGTRGVAEISDLLLLQALNRYEPLFEHLGTASIVHPETLYRLVVQLAGELATYARVGKRPLPIETYRHHDLATTFRAVIQSIRQSLNTVLEHSAVSIPLRQHKYGVQVAEIADRSLFSQATFVLAVRADVGLDRLRRVFPSQIKIGPASKIKELVNVSLPGIVISALPVAPRQIPYHVGVSYFEVDQHSSYWQELRQTGSLTLHVAGDFPNLELALWAIRGD